MWGWGAEVGRVGEGELRGKREGLCSGRESQPQRDLTATQPSPRALDCWEVEPATEDLAPAAWGSTQVHDTLSACGKRPAGEGSVLPAAATCLMQVHARRQAWVRRRDNNGPVAVGTCHYPCGITLHGPGPHQPCPVGYALHTPPLGRPAPTIQEVVDVVQLEQLIRATSPPSLLFRLSEIDVALVLGGLAHVAGSSGRVPPPRPRSRCPPSCFWRHCLPASVGPLQHHLHL